MIHEDFSTVITMLEELGIRITNWRDDKAAKHLHSIQDFKTEADKRAHSFLHDKLSHFSPDIPIISEEDSIHSTDRPHKYWLVDPIDGTASWYGGFSGFVSQVALIENSEPIFGAVVAPVFKKTWTAVKNDGARLNGSRLDVLKSSNRLLFVDNTPQPHGITEKLMIQMKASGYIECGSIGLKSCLVADGTVDLFVKPVILRDWDIAPAAVILREVRGYLALSTGSAYNYQGSMEKPEGIIVARDKSLLSKAVSQIAQNE